MPSEQDQIIGANVRRLRTALGMSQAQLAEAMSERGVVGFHPQTITKLEQGNRRLSLQEGIALAEVLGIQPVELYEPNATVGNDAKALRAMRDLGSASDALVKAYRDLVRAHGNLADIRQHLDLGAKATVAVEGLLKMLAPERELETLAKRADRPDGVVYPDEDHLVEDVRRG